MVEELDIADLRVHFIADYLIKSLRLRTDKWTKMVQIEEQNKTILEFCEKPHPNLLVFHVNPAGNLTVGTAFPTSLKSKACFFGKKSPEPLQRDSKEKIAAALNFGDLSNSALEQLQIYVNDVVRPLLTTPQNHEEWPEVILTDLQKHVSDLQSQLQVVTSLVKGKILLPYPKYSGSTTPNGALYANGQSRGNDSPQTSSRSGETIDLKLVHAVESVVIEWSHQIREVLKKDSAQPLLDGLDPIPSIEIDFWKSKRVNLESISEQLNDPRVTKMGELLAKSNSSYHPSFLQIHNDVRQALDEAQDIDTHLRPLASHFESLQTTDFIEAKNLFKPMFHIIGLVYENCRHYATASRIVVLLQEICNLIMKQASDHLEPMELFKGEIDEALMKIDDTFETLQVFCQEYEAIRTKMGSKWDFSPKLVFAKWDIFMERMNSIKDLFSTANTFVKLEKVEIGGVKGRALSAEIFQIFEEFKTLFEKFNNKTYNPLDPKNTAFVHDLEQFHEGIDDLDRRIGRIANQAFTDCNGLEAMYKLIHIFGSLIERPTIRHDFAKKYPIILQHIEHEMDEAKEIFDQQMDLQEETGSIQLDRNMPRVAGSLMWAEELKQRYTQPMEQFRALENEIVQTSDAKRVEDKYTELNQLVDRFIEELYKEWATNVSEASKFNLNQHLITRNPKNQLIQLNFHPQLETVLREVRYLEIKDRKDIPQAALEIYKENDTFLSYINNLNYTITSYNKIRETIAEVEYPLIEQQLQAIDHQLTDAENKLTWSTSGIGDYILRTRTMVFDLEQRLQKSKNNILEIQSIMATWSKSPLYERASARVGGTTEKQTGSGDNLLILADLDERLNKRYREIREAGERIHGLVEDNRQFLQVNANDASIAEYWKAYVEYIDEMIADGFYAIAQCDLEFFRQETDRNASPEPLFQVLLEVQPPEMIFTPSIEPNAPDGFADFIDGLIANSYKQSSLISRLAKHLPHANYQPDIQEMNSLTTIRHDINERVQHVIAKGHEYQRSFDRYAYLWTDDRKEFMRQFLIYGHVLTPEEIQQHALTGIPENPPTTGQFREQIDTYEAIYDEVEKIDPIQVFDKWFRIDARPFKQTLLNTVKKWSFMFKQWLIEHVTNSLNELQEFIENTNKQLKRPVKEGDYNLLVEIMAHLAAIKQREQVTDALFAPLKDTIELLKSYNQDLPEEVHQQLEILPEKWLNLKRNYVAIRQNVAPLQAQENTKIRQRLADFDTVQTQFRERFKSEAPYIYETPEAYKRLDRVNRDLIKRENVLEQLMKSSALFEVSFPDFKLIKQCRKDVKLLKQLWDYISLVRFSMNDWKSTRWREINVESMDAEVKKFQRDIKLLDKEMRAWNAYIQLEQILKNMITALRSITELRNSAIRERHWDELMSCTGVQFSMSAQTTLEELLNLNLYNYEEEVRNIVDKAVKEMSMEKTIKDIENTWTTMEFRADPHPRTGIRLLTASDELIETLEDHQVQLQNMLQSKYIAFFQNQVSTWQRKLSQADQVIQILREVQKTWAHLESIFIGTEDIRKQLPEDSKRFDEIDRDFKKVAEENQKDLNVTHCTNRDSVYEQLESIKSRLSLCEKALAEYLETKRLAFPRFYFVSPAELLDILSNGNVPEKVMRHLSKLFDSIGQLELTDDKHTPGAKLKEAVAMYSKESEKVDFPSPCDLNGQVETWLNRVLDKMRETVRFCLSEAINAFEEKPREHWVQDYPAQIALTGSQVFWTMEVNLAFSRIEEGYENGLKDYFKKAVAQLNALIEMLLTDISPLERQKIETICTIDVHARDVVGKMIQAKIESANEFLWQCQLRHRWDEKEKDCFANICDAQFRYAHEYLGNQPRLVITPLTDRCYITLTQSLHLIMGGAPAGPAGTGKTETTKDLGRALGVMVYVFNCSEQMDYQSIGNIYKGLSQTGAWGCFDEFNRISVEVLSVVAVQVKTIQDAIRDRKKRFNFMGTDIRLNPNVGLFITMNPGYAGRTELPENLKALFRPCAMVVPDIEMICEIMLVTSGFKDGKLLSCKFITLYNLCKELLSKQHHYDWGLRAVKSVLVVAGALRRADPNRPEREVLMRALRDFNIPKIVHDDLPIFMGLIGDLFPALDVPRKRDLKFEEEIKRAALDLKLQPEDAFILKVVQLKELFEVRHSVFIVGNAGTGKSQIWKTLNRMYTNQKRRPVAIDLDPKAVTNNELFGFMNPSTREWKDGLFSTIMRDLANMTHDGPKWICLDGDIDPMWIESLNTVMDDNKVLTLASNERVPLNSTMRLLFEISHLRTATPATVSRAGILYINPQDLGWGPQVATWIDSRPIQSERANLQILFDKYLPTCMEMLKSNRFKKITPLVDGCHVWMLCHLLECLLVPENCPPDCSKELYEQYFVWGCIWAMGASLFQDQLTDHRIEFSRWWTLEFKAVKFPTTANTTVFDYYIDPETKKFELWSKKVPKFELDPVIPLQSALVPTPETVRIRYWMDLLMERGYPVMLVGGAGSGKTVIVNDKLESLNNELWTVVNVPFNYYTSSEMLQSILEKPLERKAGRNYGPPGNKRLVYFIDDMNMPEMDKYFTVQAHTILRQYLDYKHWYDRQKLTLRDIHNCQYVACMNPTAGNFTIDSRIQRHFAVFAVSFPGQDSLRTIYNSILSQHLAAPHQAPFTQAVQRYVSQVVDGALAVHQRVAAAFLPTAIKFHYVFNLRDLSNIFQGILFSNGECVKTTRDLVRLYVHEAERVYGDKLVNSDDIDSFQKIFRDTVKKNFTDIDEEFCFRRPLIYTHFSTGIGDPKYMPIDNWQQLTRLLTDALENYNEVNASMNLVLFEDAMMHICRINRILESPRGNALLVGVGGSGKQSLSRLAAFVSGQEVFQITIRKGYSIADLKLDLNTLYMRSGIKSIPTVFLMTDAQVADEKFLVLINDMLASGEINGLFTDDETTEILASVKNEVRAQGIEDTKENCWKYFIDKVRRNLKIVLCFSPVGATLRVRARRFPALVNCTNIDWFHEWPETALVSVAKRFIQDVESLPTEYHDSVAQFMAYVHSSVNEMSVQYLSNERRYNYTTPKSFLEQIGLYRNLLQTKRREHEEGIARLENGLVKLESVAKQTDELKEKLKVEEIEVTKKNQEADRLIKVVETETKKVTEQREAAAIEEKEVAEKKERVAERQAESDRDLQKALPALKAAEEALNTLNRNNLTELKSFATPPAAILKVTASIQILMAQQGRVPRDRTWNAAKKTMGDVGQFLNSLLTYDKNHIPESSLKAVEEYLRDPDFNPDAIRRVSLAASGLCAWAINIVQYYRVYCEVEPKRLAAEQATEELRQTEEQFNATQAKLARLQAALQALKDQYEAAQNEKDECQRAADQTTYTINLANRLVGGLASEKERWTNTIQQFQILGKFLPGNVLITTAYLSYVGYFTKYYREELLYRRWMPYLKNLKVPIPVTDNLDPLSMLIDDADMAAWNNEGLPADRMSYENATILTNCERWPLMIDPQLQGVKWIRTRYGEKLVVIRLGAKGYMEKLEHAISAGETLLLENIEENIEAILDPLIGRNTIRKGRAIKLGDKEIEYHPEFRLIIQTKLANPHYKPEMQAQTTLINFTVTRDGLEDQLLADVVALERPDLEKSKYELTRQKNEYKISLKKLEDSLLQRLAAAKGNFLSDVALVENLEKTKITAIEIEHKKNEAEKTSEQIDKTREVYRPAAARASLLYFIMNDLRKIHPMYQFSLKAFKIVFAKASQKSEESDDVKQRVLNLIDSITYSTSLYTTRSLFEQHKLIFTSQMVFQILLTNKEIDLKELEFLLRYPYVPNLVSPVDFLNEQSWGGVKALSNMEEFHNLDRDIEGSAKRWKKFVEAEAPEKEKFPQEWKSKTSLQKLCIMRALRPDRMLYALSLFVEEKLGRKYVENRAIELSRSYEETTKATPIFFILSPGVDPLKEVESLARKMGFTTDNGKFHNISLGQGQDVVAEKALDDGSRDGHWVVLQNIHLVARWLPQLEKKLEQTAEFSREEFRVFLSAEPAADPEGHCIPQGILESAIKITNEAPTGMYANFHKALDNFDQDTMERCSKENEFKSILFALCYFHAVVAERRKFGPIGWNRRYPFNNGDLTISVDVLYNYLEANSKVPWEDLRYLFGEIMYGGHITDDWDRRLCRSYLETYINPDMFDGELFLAPLFPIPPNSDYKGYHQYIDEYLPAESPSLYGLHSNAEIDFLTTTSEALFKTVLELQPRDAGAGAAEGGSITTREEKIKSVLDDITGRLPDDFNMAELFAKTEEKTPYTVVALQECERMNALLKEMRRSLKELDSGLKGELTVTADMEALQESLYLDQVPKTWELRAYPSLFPLGTWFIDLLNRFKDLESWTSDFQLPYAVTLGYLFNPQSFLTAIMQTTARKNEWPLDRMCLSVDITKRTKDELGGAPREGAYIWGLYLEGARWDTQTSQLAEAKLKEITSAMPVIFVKAIPIDRMDTKGMYECPVYKIKTRGAHFVWTFYLKTKERPSKWVLGGVALLLQK
ncbi:unnamed protein product [Rotaria socialis]|uniref:AAA+ ATPase domain-containing protein n=1 Tax=Rotaria socialis TaxID=392032 RepID=A0A819V3P8_9BILA|nr:unnamed protein product [Rotaria socialis]CAF3329719.1 unnamed protein product [Rotaria socialis]CAF4102701.1 unnamed protein product [Rotaria socialis]CAF4168444.1 unnamed protein product [Rotaria socialis]